MLILVTYLYCYLILCQNKCECILAVDCYQDCSAPPPISTPTVCQKLDYYCQKSGDDIECSTIKKNSNNETDICSNICANWLHLTKIKRKINVYFCP